MLLAAQSVCLVWSEDPHPAYPACRVPRATPDPIHPCSVLTCHPHAHRTEPQGMLCFLAPAHPLQCCRVSSSPSSLSPAAAAS